MEDGSRKALQRLMWCLLLFLLPLCGGEAWGGHWEIARPEAEGASVYHRDGDPTNATPALREPVNQSDDWKDAPGLPGFVRTYLVDKVAAYSRQQGRVRTWFRWVPLLGLNELDSPPPVLYLHISANANASASSDSPYGLNRIPGKESVAASAADFPVSDNSNNYGKSQSAGGWTVMLL